MFVLTAALTACALERETSGQTSPTSGQDLVTRLEAEAHAFHKTGLSALSTGPIVENNHARPALI
jgi:hypothetical protein